MGMLRRMGDTSVCFIVASNDEEVLRTSLLASPDLNAGVEISVQREAKSAVEAYNRGIEATRAEVLVFVHQDIFLPAGWMTGFQEALRQLAETDPNWGVLGLYGVKADRTRCGWIYSTGLGCVLGTPFDMPQEVRTIDELLLVIRKSSNLRFDEGLPGFHFYGTDLCLIAESKGFRNYVLPCFAIHNSNGLAYLPKAFWKAYFYVRSKWRDKLPFQTPCITVRRSVLPTLVQEIPWRVVRYTILRQKPGGRVQDPGLLFKGLVDSGIISGSIGK